MILANSDKVSLRRPIYPQVALANFMHGLQTGLPQGQAGDLVAEHIALAGGSDFTPMPSQKISVKRFFQRINQFLDNDSLIISDVGSSTLLGAAQLFLPDDVPFIAQAFYVSIGYALPATLEAKLAAPKLRPITFVGDGAFQMTV
jgi:TPP-dependent 2-oxoacid decarboxylase